MCIHDLSKSNQPAHGFLISKEIACDEHDFIGPIRDSFFGFFQKLVIPPAAQKDRGLWELECKITSSWRSYSRTDEELFTVNPDVNDCYSQKIQIHIKLY